MVATGPGCSLAGAWRSRAAVVATDIRKDATSIRIGIVQTRVTNYGARGAGKVRRCPGVGSPTDVCRLKSSTDPRAVLSDV